MRKNAGYTLVELIITLVIIVILMSFAIGPIRDMLLRNRVANQANLFQLDFTFARSEAINRSYPVVIAPQDTWSESWNIFIDLNGNDTRDNGEEVIRTTTFDETNLTLVDSGNDEPLIFTRLGSLKGSVERSITVSHDELQKKKAVFIAAAGSVSVRTIQDE